MLFASGQTSSSSHCMLCTKGGLDVEAEDMFIVCAVRHDIMCHHSAIYLCTAGTHCMARYAVGILDSDRHMLSVRARARCFL